MNDHKTNADEPAELRPSTEVDNNLVTIFAIPKAFSGQIGLIQRNAINSWTKLGPHVNVVLVGDDTSVEETASELGVHHLPSIRRNKYDTPLVGSAFDSVSQFSVAPILIYCNADVILMPDFLAAIKSLVDSHGSSPFLAIGRRTDLKVETEIDFENKNDLRELLQDLRDNGKPAAIVCKEFFAFSRDLYSEVPDFAVGRGNWDNWMVASARAQGVPVVDIGPVATVIHQTHDYGHLGGDRLRCYVTGEEARENQKLAGGRNLVRGSSSTWVLKHDGLHRRKFAWANLSFWSDSVPFVRLMLNLMTTRQ